MATKTVTKYLVMGGVCGLAWAASMRGRMARLADGRPATQSHVTWYILARRGERFERLPSTSDVAGYTIIEADAAAALELAMPGGCTILEDGGGRVPPGE